MPLGSMNAPAFRTARLGVGTGISDLCDYGGHDGDLIQRCAGRARPSITWRYS
jgi:hypothetical protein